MIATDAEPISEQKAKKLLEKVRSFRQQWARFAVQADCVFRSFREKGESLPEVFLSSCRQLDDQKASLSQEIAHSVIGVDPELWQAPSPKDSLNEFEHKLDDLILLARELARVIAEKRDRYLGVLRAVKELQSDDAAVDRILMGLRAETDREISDLSTCASRLADINLEGTVQSFIHLLDISNDARNRLYGTQDPTTLLTSEECRLRFESVSAKFSLPIAIEALRTGLAKRLRSNSDATPRTPPAFTTSVSKDAADSSTLASTGPATIVDGPNVSIQVSELNDRPTKEALASLVNNFGNKSVVVAPPRRPVPVTPIIATNPVSLSKLADAGKSLKIKAHGLYPNSLDLGKLDADPDVIKNCAIGLACLSEMIEVVGYVFAERERNTDYRGKSLREILQLFAEVQNVVRVDAEQSGKPSVAEQITAFTWLRYVCSEDGEAIHIDRFMRLDDRADPGTNPERARRVLRLRQQILRLQEAEKDLIQLKQLCQQLSPSNSPTSLETNLPIWAQIIECVSQLIRNGLKPSDRRIRDILLPIVDDFPETLNDENDNVVSQGVEMSSEFQLVINAIYKYMLQHPAPVQESIEPDTEAVVKVSNRLQNKVLVVVGGIRKPRAAQRLKHKLKVREVRWLEATKQDRVSEFRSSLNGAEVVLLITRLIGHKHNDIRDMCRAAGIPWVQTPVNAGYHPNTVASEILRQASEQLQTA